MLSRSLMKLLLRESRKVKKHVTAEPMAQKNGSFSRWNACRSAAYSFASGPFQAAELFCITSVIPSLARSQNLACAFVRSSMASFLILLCSSLDVGMALNLVG